MSFANGMGSEHRKAPILYTKHIRIDFNSFGPPTLDIEYPPRITPVVGAEIQQNVKAIETRFSSDFNASFK
jgi:hypothetical protein